jgi:hypothetical protein
VFNKGTPLVTILLEWAKGKATYKHKMKINNTCLKVDGMGVSTSKILLNSKPFSIVKWSFDVKSSN